MTPSSSSTNGPSLQSTPMKGGEREKHPFPPSAHPSPAPLKHSSSSASTSSSTAHFHTTSTSMSSASLAAPQPTITLEGLLKQHASAPDPNAAALEHLVVERNAISSQNVQLWKLIEKQRAGYNQILKELERIRAERDGYKSKLAVLSGGSVAKTPKSSDRAAKLSLVEPSPLAKHGSSSSRVSQHRHYSNDDALTPRNQHHPSLQSSRSHEPLSPRNSDSNFQLNASYSPSTPLRSTTPPPPPPPSSAPSAFNTPSTSRTTPRPAPSPLVLPVRNDSPAIPSSAISISLENAPFARQVQAFDDNTATNSGPSSSRSQIPTLNRSAAYPPRKSSLAEGGTTASVMVSGIPNSPVSATMPTPKAHNYSMSSQAPTSLSSQKEERSNDTQPSNFPQSLQSDTSNSRQASAATPVHHGSQHRLTPQIITTTAAGNQPPDSQIPNEPHMLNTPLESRAYLSRESRISLPDEARQYIANMADSPTFSPRVENFASGSTVAVPQPSAPLVKTSEFLDLDMDDGEEEEEEEEEVEDDDDGDDSDQKGSGASLSAHSQGPSTPTHSNFSRQDQSSSESQSESTPIRPRKDKSRVAAEEFPLPPPSNVYVQRQQGAQEGQQAAPQQISQLQDSDQGPSSKQQQSSGDQPSSNSVHQPESLNNLRANGFQQISPASHSDMKPPTSQSQPSSQSVAGSFRALPLLSSDLRYTAIQVSHSFVRPNDRGKEVLSFIVSVNPGKNKPGWKVEKMYSDVLSLDARVRSTVGKGVGKKIGNLPEGKLWKDHAPARVDQRKAVLEQYLQSLIQLPIKNNDEVIAFFTSDIVRETKQPVMQVGHKEGYLTKRGKNFGGWKTRFFVLQGPVLEYYDCRGGAHLGSIQITGAQIARQHRTEKTAVTDEEKEYRHAFLIVESKKGPGGNHPRHVLCAESDEDRDTWVELLVRYYTGSYNEDLVFNASSGMNSAVSISSAAPNYASSPIQSRTSTSSNDLPLPSSARKPPSRPPLAVDDYIRSVSPSRLVDPSPIDRNGPTPALHDAQMKRADRAGLPSSLPDSSPLSSVQPIQSDGNVIERATSELGHYSDLRDNRSIPISLQPRQQSPERQRPRDIYDGRHTNFSSTNLQSGQGQVDRAPSPEKSETGMARVKISGPMNGTPIPSGFKFGGKDPSTSELNSANDRREKAKSRSFWGFGKANGDKSHGANFPPRAVFAVPLEESLDVAQICGLPAIIFRSIQYLEAKKADQEEGIYRLSGSSAVIKNLKDMFNTEGDVDLLASDEYWDPHAIAGLLKCFLRDLPASILTREMHLRFLAVIDLLNPQERIRELSQLIAALPIANYTLLRALTAHLILIVQNANVNKMTMRNVGIVFSPTLGIPAGVFSLMLAEFNRVFNVDNEDDATIQTDDSFAKLSEQASQPVRRNSQRYSDTAADQLLGFAGRFLSTAAEESQSDGDDFSVHDESGTETTEGEAEMTIESASPSPDQDVIQPEQAFRITPPETPTASKLTRASHVAASRGLNVTVAHSERGNRHSKMIGLPASPRPPVSPARAQEPAP